MNSPDNTQDNHIIALDAMGGDDDVEIVIPGAAMVLEEQPSLKFLIYGDEARVMPLLDKYPQLKAASTFEHTDRAIAGDEKPSAALRSSKGSSMRLAIEAVKEGRAQAVVSAGNTGALMALSLMVLKPLEGIHRPAIASIFPTIAEGSDTIMLDLGANVLVDAQNLVEFALLGAVFASEHKGVERPTVGLLNVGTEETKGPDHVRGAAEILSQIDFPGEYIGFVEGDDITKGVVDVVVSDGYAGNIALKTAEGVGKFSSHYFKKTLGSDLFAILGGLMAFFALKRLKKKMDPRLYNGGVFLGLNGISVKSHGGTDALGFSSAVKLAAELATHGYVQKVSDEINHLTEQEKRLSGESVNS